MANSANLRIVKCAVELNAPPEAVFKALTVGEELARWFPDGAETDPRAGGKLVFWWTKDRTDHSERNRWETKFSTFKPPYEVSYPFTELVTYRLTAEKGKTKLQLIHECPEENAIGVAIHWGGLVLNLKTYVEHGLDLRSLWGWKH